MRASRGFRLDDGAARPPNPFHTARLYLNGLLGHDPRWETTIMRNARNPAMLAIAASSMLASPAAQATNGYFSHGYSTKEKGLAGAGTAFSQDSLAAATNPAGLAFVEHRLDVGMALFSPSPRGYSVGGAPPVPGDGSVTVFAPPAGAEQPPTCNFADPASGACAPPFSLSPGEVDSENAFFLVPHFGYNWRLSPEMALGFSAYGNGGMNTEYESGSALLPNPNSASPAAQLLPIEARDGTYGAGTAGVNLAQLFLNASFAYAVHEAHAVGASLIVAGQRFAAQGLENFGQFSLDPDNLSGDRASNSFGAGFKLGYQGEVVSGVRVGAAYQSKIHMSKFDEYSGLFANGGDFDIPSTFNVGVSVNMGPIGMLLVDLQHIRFSDVAAVSNGVAPLINGECVNALNATIQNGFAPAPASGAGCLGGSGGAGFGWDDMTIVKLGYQIDVSDHTIRAGFSHASQPISETETLFNVLAPAVIQDHLTAGWTLRIGENQELNAAAMYAFKGGVRGANPFDGGATQIEIEMTQFDLQAGWAMKF